MCVCVCWSVCVVLCGLLMCVGVCDGGLCDGVDVIEKCIVC